MNYKHYFKPHQVQIIIPLILLFLLTIPLTLQAQDSITDDEVNEVAKGLYCPVCESTPLDTCPTQACADWRELIHDQLASGMSKQDIYDYFSVQYGDGVLAEPPRQGFNLLLWLSPLLAITVGGAIFVKMMRQLKTAVPKQAPPPKLVTQKQAKSAPKVTPDLDQYVSQIEAELKELSNG